MFFPKHLSRERSLKPGILWAVEEMERWGQLTGGFYILAFGTGRIAHGRERDLLQTASPFPRLTALLAFRAKGSTRHLTGPMYLARFSHSNSPSFSFSSNHTGFPLSPLFVTLPLTTGPLHMLPLCLKCFCFLFFT